MYLVVAWPSLITRLPWPAPAAPPPPPAPPAPRRRRDAAAATCAAFSALVVWPLKNRVGANSPSLWPTMFSVMYTGMNFFPLCTAIVCPTISGITVDRRDQVLMTFFSFSRFIASTFSSRWRSMNGPFFSDLPISALDFEVRRYFFRRSTMNRSRALVAARLVALGRHAPRRHRMPAAGRLAFAAAERVIDRVHRDAAHVRPLAQPAAAAGLADRHVLVVDVADLADGREALDVDQPDFARRHLHRRVEALPWRPAARPIRPTARSVRPCPASARRCESSCRAECS